ncbi:tRNA (adenosine(37)-N6)-threonylcarbamoyltransferase complex dimerization subunit type 1 TsaB [Pokkaliibacter plantistimulans]|uniref:tRNA threonylcarbamoyladenosine biosynthesis protein TsaB n=1 Tax=Proteobacteria bacterium 228 TaxID=2083153 RepID=A0A2S5KWF0_9PROT|nr:tRNA (adenosine(37)-N6)-threonylcarbamoyltransferase complex dimerization subunit type 1 TsaB [Pokkaliibacter plantistimulans]PPC79043.1 tRNA (adenosine(37)-N6)-threonylcarbamoyltransferase complex dimerization subunit type 1 TsaB [Pokkaliibacter plantistimulans]
MSYILALDATTEACSVALLAGEQVIEDFQVIPRLHAQRLLPMIEALLAQAGVSLAQLDALAYGRGPGAFTGIRIAAGVAQGLAYAVDRPLYPVSTLAAMAQGAWRETGKQAILASLDARMDEVYWSAYRIEQGLAVLQGDEQVLPPENVVSPSGEWLGWGSGWRYASRFSGAVQPHSHHVEVFPHAQDVTRLAMPLLAAGVVIRAEEALPVYIRDQVTHKAAG